jgi:hypothetical protein
LGNFAVYLNWRADFAISVAFLLGTALLFFAAIISLLRNLIFERSVSRAVCPILIILSLVTAVWIKRDMTRLADVVFFSLNETELRKEAQLEELNNGTKRVFRSSFGNAHRLFIHVGRRQFKSEPLSLEEIDSVGDPLEAFRGCMVFAAPLRGGYYAFYVEC